MESPGATPHLWMLAVSLLSEEGRRDWKGDCGARIPSQAGEHSQPQCWRDLGPRLSLQEATRGCQGGGAFAVPSCEQESLL